MKDNILLIIVDCLRYDHVTHEIMPSLTYLGRQWYNYENYWSTSHCTDPVITQMLSGKHPDELRLYSMMYEHRDYTIPEDVEMLAQTAMKHGYSTGSVTNIGRWYRRGVKRFADCRGWLGDRIFGTGIGMIQSLPRPWFVMIHTDDCHTRYTNGSYKSACKYVDKQIERTMQSVAEDRTLVIITADHGEGLGQKGIMQHGYGLWPFLTHVPFITNYKVPITGDVVLNPGTIYEVMKATILGGTPPRSAFPDSICQAGDTPPNIRHRGVVFPDGRQYIRKTVGNHLQEELALENGELIDGSMLIFVGHDALFMHCEKYGISLIDDGIDPIVEERLRNLGYFE